MGTLALMGVGDPAATSGAFLSDSFTDTAGTSLISHTPEAGGPWTMLAGSNTDFQIDNTAARLYCPSQSNPSMAVGASPPSADYSVFVNLQNFDNLTGAGIVARASLSSGLNGYLMRLANDFPGTRWQLFKYVSGTRTSLGTGTVGNLAGGTMTMELIVSGTTITGKINGSSVISVTDTSISAIGAPGVFQDGNNQGQSTGHHWIDILVS